MINRSQVQEALHVWRRPAPPRAELGAPLIHGSRPPAQAAPGRRLCARRPPRRHQRALVLVDDQRRQRPGHARGRRPQLRAARRTARASCSRTRSIRPATCSSARTSWSARRAGTCSASSSTTSAPIPHHMHQSDEQAKLLGRKGKPEAYYFPPQYNETSTTSPTRSWASSPAPRRRTSALPRELEPRRQRHHLPVEGLPARARHRLADRSAHPARAGLARHLRAAGQQRRLRDVPVRGRRPHRPLGPAGQGRACPSTTRISTTSSSMLDWDANVNPNFGADNKCFPKPVRPIRRDRDEGLSGAVGLLRHASGTRRRS